MFSPGFREKKPMFSPRYRVKKSMFNLEFRVNNVQSWIKSEEMTEDTC